MQPPSEARAAQWGKVLNRISGAIETALGEVQAQERTLTDADGQAPTDGASSEDFTKTIGGHRERIEGIARRVAEAGELIDREIEAVEEMRRRIHLLHERLQARPKPRAAPES